MYEEFVVGENMKCFFPEMMTEIFYREVDS